MQKHQAAFSSSSVYQYYLRLSCIVTIAYTGEASSSRFFSLSVYQYYLRLSCVVTIAYIGEASSSCFFSLFSVSTLSQTELRCNYCLHWGSFFKPFFSLFQCISTISDCCIVTHLHWGSFFKLFSSFTSEYQHYLRLSCVVTIAYNGEASSSCFFSFSFSVSILSQTELRCNYRLHWGSFFKPFFPSSLQCISTISD